MLQGALTKFDAAVEKYPKCAEGMALYAQVGRHEVNKFNISIYD